MSLHDDGSNSFLFVNCTKIYQFKAKDSQVRTYPLCFGNVSVDFSAINMIKTGLDGSVCDFSVDYNITDTSKIIDIHKYLMKKHNIKKCFDLLKVFVVAMLFSRCNAFKCVSINTQECKIRPQIINANSNESPF